MITLPKVFFGVLATGLPLAVACDSEKKTAAAIRMSQMRFTGANRLGPVWRHHQYRRRRLHVDWRGTGHR